ncbi:response regulator transcription factor [Desulfovibrio sp. OttesenSCG-928-C06]|nr:response regulator transcription factor [Desulfovibrio sp. OttesenSCG-928-C06]
MQKVLIIDDDRELCGLLADYLGLEGFECSFAHDGLDGMNMLAAGHWSLVVLDVMLPKCGGFDVLRFIRSSDALAALPVLMLTARGGEQDRIAGLEAGADDYLSKPFSPGELAARLRALLRRARFAAATGVPSTSHGLPSVVSVGDLVLNRAGLRVTIKDALVQLTPVEFRIMDKLLENPGQVVTREDLSVAALGHGVRPFERALDTNISRLRAKLGPHADGGQRILAIRGTGYMYVLTDALPGDA